jgi:hypothetical protein
LFEDEGLEQLQRHLLRQAALVQLELRTDHDDRTARVVDALAQQVLAETAALALDHVGQRLQRTLVGAGHCLAATTVVEQRIHSFLQHALFVAHDDFRRLQFEQALQAVVAVDDAAIQIVQVGRRETAAIQRHQRTQVRRQHRQHFENHPLRLDAGLLEASSTLRRLEIFFILASEPVASSSPRSFSTSRFRSSERSSSRTPSAPMNAVKSSPYSSTLAR